MTAEAQIQSCHPHPKSPSSLSDNSQRRFSVRKSLGLLLKRESSRSSLKDDAESPTSPMSPVILTTPRTAATTPPNIILRSPQKGKRKKSAEGNRPWTSGLPQASLAEKRKPFFLQTGTLGLRNFRQRSSNSIPLEDPISNDHATIVLADGHQGVGSQPHPLSDPEDRERLRSRSAPIVSSPQFLPTKPAMRSSKPLPKPPINVPVRTCSSPLSDNDGSSYVAALGHIAPLGPHRAGTPNSFNSLLERYMDPSPQEIEAALKEVEQAPAVDDNSEESIRRIDEARRSVTSTELNVPSLPPSARRIKRMGVLFGEDGTREEFTEAEADELDVKEKILTPKGSLPPVPRPSSSWTNAFRSSTTKPLPLSPSSNSDAVPALKKRPSSFRLWRDDAPAGNSWSRSAVPAFSSDMGVPELPYVDPKVEIGTTELHHINGLRERSASSPSVPSKTGVKNNAAAQWDAAESAAESRRLTAIDVAKADLITPCVTAGVDALALSRSEKIAAMKADGVHCKKVEVKVSISERNSDMGVESSTEVVSVTVDAPCSAVVKKAEVHQLRQPVEGKSETGTSTSAVENSRKTNSEMIQPVIGDVGTKPRRPSLIDRLFNMTKKRSSRNLSKEAESGGWRIDVGRIISNRKEPSNSEDICTNSPAAPSSTIASSFSPTGPTSPLSIVTSEAPLPALPTAEPTSPASPRPRRSLSVPFHLRRLSIVSNPDSSSDVDVTGYRKRSQTVSNPLSTPELVPDVPPSPATDISVEETTGPARRSVYESLQRGRKLSIGGGGTGSVGAATAWLRTRPSLFQIRTGSATSPLESSANSPNILPFPLEWKDEVRSEARSEVGGFRGLVMSKEWEEDVSNASLSIAPDAEGHWEEAREEQRQRMERMFPIDKSTEDLGLDGVIKSFDEMMEGNMEAVLAVDDDVGANAVVEEVPLTERQEKSTSIVSLGPDFPAADLKRMLTVICDK